MYKAIRVDSGQEIIILNPSWLKKIDQLRQMDRVDLLVCQGCQQPLRVKAGEWKRPHFAHKHLKACSYGTESPQILAARAVLYQWLFRQFGEAVNIEKVLPGSGLPRPLDCWVERESGGFAYWIIEAGIKLETRKVILAALGAAGSAWHAVFLSSMLNEEKKEFQSLLLTPTERAFLHVTPFDETLAGIRESGQSLHYLDAEHETWTTFRDLRLHHRPNWFVGRKKITSLELTRASMLTGDPLHPGEMELLKRHQQKQLHLERKQKSYHEREAEWQQHLRERRQEQQGRDAWGIDQQSDKTDPHQAAALPCELCGQVTTDYWYAYTSEDGRRLCRCRECLAR